MPKKIKKVYALIHKDKSGNEYLLHLSDDIKNILRVDEAFRDSGLKLGKMVIYSFSNKENVKLIQKGKTWDKKSK